MIHELLGDILRKQEKIDLAKISIYYQKINIQMKHLTSIVAMKISNLSK